VSRARWGLSYRRIAATWTHEGHLEEEEPTLGVQVDLSHCAPIPPGTSVEIRVELIEVAGRQLVFDVLAHDDATKICRGRHRRAVIDRARFTAKLAARSGAQAAGTGAW
jgi:fluoroacetyl-CoA thioesterase